MGTYRFSLQTMCMFFLVGIVDVTVKNDVSYFANEFACINNTDKKMKVGLLISKMNMQVKKKANKIAEDILSGKKKAGRKQHSKKKMKDILFDRGDGDRKRSTMEKENPLIQRVRNI